MTSWGYPVPIRCHVFQKLPNNFKWKFTARKEPALPTSFTIKWKIVSVWTEILFCDRAQLQLTTLIPFWAFRFIGYFSVSSQISFSSFPPKSDRTDFLRSVVFVLIWGSTLEDIYSCACSTAFVALQKCRNWNSYKAAVLVGNKAEGHTDRSAHH